MIVLAEEKRFAEGWCAPTLTREKASEIYGRDIPIAAWVSIKVAFMDYSCAMGDQVALRPVRGKSRPESFYRSQQVTLRTLQSAIDNTCKATSERKLWEDQGLDAVQEKLDAALWHLIDARRAIEDLMPPEINPPSKAEPERRLTIAICDALTAAGLDVSLSDGWKHDAFERNVSLDDLTAFEKLCGGFGIHADAKPKRLSRWLRDTLGGK